MSSQALIEPTVEYIQGLVPLRYPVLLVDRVLEWEPGKTITATKAFTTGESLFGGASPLNGADDGVAPCVSDGAVPEALMIESMIQVAGLTMPKRLGQYVYLLGLNRVELLRRCKPGERMITRAVNLWNRGHMFRVRAESRVEEDVVVSGEVTYAYLDTAE